MDVIAVANLKFKIIKDFQNFLQQLYKGSRPNYDLLMQEICVIENPDYFNNVVYEYLMTHE